MPPCEDVTLWWGNPYLGDIMIIWALQRHKQAHTLRDNRNFSWLVKAQNLGVSHMAEKFTWRMMTFFFPSYRGLWYMMHIWWCMWWLDQVGIKVSKRNWLPGAWQEGAQECPAEQDSYRSRVYLIAMLDSWRLLVVTRIRMSLIDRSWGASPCHQGPELSPGWIQ